MAMSMEEDIFDQEIYQSCPECQITKQSKGKLKLKFAKCCGRRNCEDCLDISYKHGALASINCKSCGHLIKRTEWSDRPLERQKFLDQAKLRKDMNETFHLEASDFDTLQEYNDYLEDEQDIIYSALYGTLEEQKQSKIRRKEFEEKHRERLERAFAKKIGASRKLHDPDMNKPSMANVTQSIPTFVLPTALESAPVVQSNLAPEVLAFRRKQAGGYRQEDDHQRCTQEALAALPWFC